MYYTFILIDSVVIILKNSCPIAVKLNRHGQVLHRLISLEGFLN